MKLLLLYWTLLQSTLTSFSGLTSLPVIRHDLVLDRHWITDTELNSAVMIGRSTPGPMGVYIVCVGYFVAGVPGAVAGAFALATPALLIILLLRLLGGHADHPRVKNAIRMVVLAGTAFSAVTLLGMARSALNTPLLCALAATSFGLLLRTKIMTIWILVGAGVVTLLVK